MHTCHLLATVKAGEYVLAWRAFRALRSQGLDPDSVTYSLMISLCSREDRVERALQFRDEMLDHGLPLTEVTYNSLILACARRKDILCIPYLQCYCSETFGLIS